MNRIACGVIAGDVRRRVPAINCSVVSRQFTFNPESSTIDFEETRTAVSSGHISLAQFELNGTPEMHLHYHHWHYQALFGVVFLLVILRLLWFFLHGW